MERDFEKEFIELKLSEVPDLWNRIEAGLTEKRAVSSASGSRLGYGRRNMVKRAAWRKWGTLAAACLCVAILYPMVSLLLRNMGNKNSSYSGSASDTAAEDTAMNGMAASEAAAEGADMASDDASMSGAFADGTTESIADAGSFDMAENAGAAGEVQESAQATDTAENAGAGAMQESAQDAEAADSSQSGAAETAKSDITDMAQELEEAERKADTVKAVPEDGQILEDVVVSISMADTSGEADLYQAKVLRADADGALESEMQIEIICNAETEYAFLREPREKGMLKAGESYMVSLRYEKAEGRFMLITAAKEK